MKRDTKETVGFVAIFALAVLLAVGPIAYGVAGCIAGLRKRSACVEAGGIMQKDWIEWPVCIKPVLAK
jgi:hypothetical protein